MRSTWAALISLTSVVFAPILPAIAQDVAASPVAQVTQGAPIAPDSISYNGTESYTGSVGLGGGSYLFLREDIGQGIGYRQGFTTIGGFAPLMLSRDGGFFGQAQLFVTDSGRFGGNVGGGARYFAAQANRVFGAYGFYDFDDTQSGVNMDQIGLGFETLGPMWDFRVNGYVPLNNDRSFYRLTSLGTTPVFSGNFLQFAGTASYQRMMAGADAEIGVPLLDPSLFGRLRTYFGGYAYDGTDRNQVGIRARIEDHINEHVTIGAAFMHDNVNGDLATMSVDIRGWRSGLPALNNSEISNRAKLYLPVVRQYRIANERFQRGITAAALGTDGTPIDIVWVDNSSTAPGNGTFENPFTAMPGTAPGADYILVRQGNSTAVNPVIGGITLSDGQKLFGEGFNFNFTVTGSQFGTGGAGSYSISSLLPAWDTFGNHPYVSNPAGDVVTLANDNEVGGLNIVSSTGHGITGTGINNFNLFDLNIGTPGFGNGGAGIQLTNASGIGTINNFTMTDNVLGGIIVNNTATAALTLTIAGHAQATPNLVGGAVGVSLSADNSTITANLTNVQNTGSGSGLVLNSDNAGSLTATASGSKFNDTTSGDGVQATVGTTAAATLAMTLTNFSADNAFGNGLSLSVANGSTFSGAVSGTAAGGSSFSGAGGDGARIIVDNSPNATNALSFTNTNLNNNGQAATADGIHIELTNGSVFAVAVHNAQVNGNSGDAIDTSLDGTSTLGLTVDPTSLSNNGENGFRFNVVNSSILNAAFEDVTINGNGQNGILGTLDTLGVANLGTLAAPFTNVTASGNGENGMFVTATGGATMNGFISLSEFSDNGAAVAGSDGINLHADAGNINLALSGTTLANTSGSDQSSGLEFLAENAGAVDISIQGGQISLNSDDGVKGEVHDAGTVAQVSFNGATVTGNDGNGVGLLVDSGATLEATVSGASVMSANGGDGFQLTANDALTIARVNMSSNNQFNDQASGAGVRITATDVDEITAIISGSASNNGDQGVLFDITNVNDIANNPIAVAIGVTGFGDISNNGSNGIEFNVTTSTINALFTEGADVSNNALGGILVNVDNSNILDSGSPLLPAVQIGGGSIDGNNGGSGIEVNFDTVTQAAAGMVAIGSSSSISDNDVDGIRINLLNTPLDGLQVSNNFNVDGNGEHGLHFQLTGSDLTNLLVSGNSFTNNAAGGMQFFGDSNVDGTFDGNTFSDNGAEGVAINLDNAENFTGVFTGNDFSGNSGVGLLVNAEDTSTFDLTVGTAGAGNGNTFDGNEGAGLGLTLLNSAVGHIGIENSSFTNTTVGTNPIFAGQGVQISVATSAQIDATSYVRSSEFTDNAAAGLRVVASGDDLSSFAIIQGMTVGGATPAEGNLFQSNGGNGMEFIRTGNGEIGLTSAILVQNNLFAENTGNGFLFDAAGTPLFTDRYIVNNNTSRDNTLSGAQLFVRADASMNVDMDLNIFDSNTVDGLTLSEQVNTATDQRFVDGTWTRNEFTDNGRHGIGMFSNVSTLMIGDLVSDPLGNLISGNTNDGISVNGPGQFTIARNEISDNGSNTTVGDNDAGIDIHSSTFLNLTIFNNDIISNHGDGIENQTDGPFSVTLNIQNNFIAFNDGRGFDLLAQPNATTHSSSTDVVFNNNVVNQNGEEGVYVIFTGSETQTQNGASTDALLADGQVNAFSENPRLRFDMTNNQIVGNGSSSGFTATGLVVRVGTTGSGATFGAPFNTGDFVSDGVSVGSAFQNSGVIMRVAGNSFTGNFGDDVYFDSFTSTETPLATAGTWSNTQFQITDVRGDPLARLDLHWGTNTFESTNTTNVGAFYNNAEGTFKSRSDTATDPGPFDAPSAARNRNAQRIASRVTGVTPPATPGGASDQYLYPGTGPSSFRVRGGLGNVLGGGFQLDTVPYNDTGDANGIFLVTPFFDMPYGWTYLGP